MAKYPIYSYRDAKVGFMAPTCDTSDQSAIRGFSFAVNSKDGIMNYSPKDFDLYRIGVFESDTGCIETCIPVLVVSGSSVYGVNDR